MLLFAIVATISLPMVLSAFETYDRLRAENDLVTEIARFVNISMLYLDAGGGRADVTLRVSDGLLHHVDFVEFGGPLDSPDCASIRYRFIGERMQYLTLEDHGLRFTGSDGPLQLSAGLWEVHLEVRNDEFGAFMFLSLD